MAANGAGPSPASSMTRTPRSGPTRTAPTESSGDVVDAPGDGERLEQVGELTQCEPAGGALCGLHTGGRVDLAEDRSGDRYRRSRIGHADLTGPQRQDPEPLGVDRDGCRTGAGARQGDSAAGR